MTTHKLFPQVSHVAVLDAIGRTPYLDVQWQFQLNLNDFFSEYRNKKPTVKAGTSFKKFKEERRSRAAFRQLFDDGDLFQDLDLFSDYVLGLRKKVNRPGLRGGQLA